MSGFRAPTRVHPRAARALARLEQEHIPTGTPMVWPHPTGGWALNLGPMPIAIIDDPDDRDAVEEAIRLMKAQREGYDIVTPPIDLRKARCASPSAS